MCKEVTTTTTSLERSPEIPWRHSRRRGKIKRATVGDSYLKDKNLSGFKSSHKRLHRVFGGKFRKGVCPQDLFRGCYHQNNLDSYIDETPSLQANLKM